MFPINSGFRYFPECEEEGNGNVSSSSGNSEEWLSGGHVCSFMPLYTHPSQIVFYEPGFFVNFIGKFLKNPVKKLFSF